jgi:hypothetical protein
MWVFSRRQKKEAERNGDPPVDIGDITNNLLQTVNSAVIAAKYMEIVTALSDNINAKIDPRYQDLVQAITARSGNVIATESTTEGKEAITTRVKADDELRAEILARTWIGLDGDVAMILPKSRVGIDPEVLQLHKANVDVAVQNWRYFLDTMIKGIQILAGYTLPAR